MKWLFCFFILLVFRCDGNGIFCFAAKVGTLISVSRCRGLARFTAPVEKKSIVEVGGLFYLDHLSPTTEQSPPAAEGDTFEIFRKSQ